MNHRKSAIENRKSNGFTLLEIILAITIFLLITGSVFTLTIGATRLGAELENSWTRHQQLTRFVDLCRTTLRTMPPEVRIEGKREETGGRAFQGLAFQNLHDWFGLGTGPSDHRTTILQTYPRTGGGVEIRLVIQDDSTASLSTSRDSEIVHLILPDLREVTWRYFNPSNQLWLEVWTDAGSRPSLIEVTLLPMESDIPIRGVFWLPPVQPRSPE